MKKSKNRTQKEREAFEIVGRLGGQTTFKRIGKKGMSALGKLGAASRWGNK